MNATVEKVLDPLADEMAPPNSMVFDLAAAQRGERLNRFAYSLKAPSNRDAFRADPAAYMTRFGLTAFEQDLVLQEDWQGLLHAGASVYLLVKLIGTIGSNLVKAGLQMRDESLDAFMASRPPRAAPLDDRRGPP